jgi:hypothetical protein
MLVIVFCLPPLLLVVWVKFAINPILASLLFSLNLFYLSMEIWWLMIVLNSYRMPRTRASDAAGTSQGGDNTPNPPNPPLAPTLADAMAVLMNVSAENARILQALA